VRRRYGFKVRKPFGKRAFASSSDRAGGDDDLVAVMPVDRRRHRVCPAQLEGIDHPEDLLHVATDVGGIGEGQLHLLVRVDHEHRAHRGGLDGVGADHPVQVGDAVVPVADERVVEPGALGFGDVVRPAPVRVHGVDAHPDELDVALGEVVLAAGELAELGGAHRREVGRMGEQESPAVAQVLVQAEASLGGLGGEIGGGVAQLDRHGSSSNPLFLVVASISGGEPYCRLQRSDLTSRWSRSRTPEQPLSQGGGPMEHGGTERAAGGDPACWAHLVCPECGAIETEGHRAGCRSEQQSGSDADPSARD